MPRPTKGPRLYLVPARAAAPGRRARAARWVVRDGDKMHATGCAPGQVAEAYQALADYVKAAHQPARSERRADAITVADVLSIYTDDVVTPHPDVKRIAKRIARLNAWWGEKKLGEVTGSACRAYTKTRPGAGGARRDLQDLSAAIGHHHREGFHREEIKVWLPSKGSARERWLSRSEIAKLVWTAWRAREEGKREGKGRYTARHIARFILLAYATASRPGAVLTASWDAASGRSYIDLDRGIFYRLREGGRATNKRQPPVRLPDRILAHLRRWQRQGGSYVVEYRGKPVSRIKVGFASVVDMAKLGEGISPHTFRHSSVTHMLQQRVDPWQVTGFAGMTEAVMRSNYAHHHPDHMGDAVAAMNGSRRRTTGALQIDVNRSRT